MGDAADDAERRAQIEYEEEGTPMGDGADDERDSGEREEMQEEMAATVAAGRKPVADLSIQELTDELAEHAARTGVEVEPAKKLDALRVQVEAARHLNPTVTVEEVEGELVAEEDGAAEEVTLAEVEAREAKMMLERVEIQPAPTALPSPSEWAAAKGMAETIVNTEFVPVSYRGRPEAVIAAILAGRELGIGPMQALRSIHMIDGRPALAAELQLALLRRHGVQILSSESTNQRAMIHARRGDTGEEAVVEWTMEEADRAQLTSKKNWRTYPADMLWSRCVGRLSRRLASDLVAGMPYTAEEVADFDLQTGSDAYEPFEQGTVREPFRQNQAGRVETPRSWTEIFAWAEPYGPELGWGEWVKDASELLFQSRARADLSAANLTILGQKASGAVIALRDKHEPGAVPPPSRKDVQDAWASVLDGLALPGPAWRMSPDEEDRPPWADPEAEPLLGAVDEEPESAEDVPLDEARAQELAEAEDIPFGE